MRKRVLIAFLLLCSLAQAPIEIVNARVVAVVDLDKTFTAVSLGASTSATCAVRTDLSVSCLGQTNREPFGSWSSSRSTGFTDVSSVVIGDANGCVLKIDGTIYCWGESSQSGLGNGQTSSDATFASPVQVSDITNAISISTSDYVYAMAPMQNTCAVLTDYTAKCWGFNLSGSLGDDSATARATPVAVADLSNIRSIANGLTHSCALLRDGTAKCWGSGSSGQLGNGSSTTPTPTGVKVVVTGLVDAIDIKVGVITTCALIQGGSVKCWGSGSGGLLGNGSTTTSNVPVFVSGITTAIALDVGGTRACAVLTSGAVKCWGENSDGALDSSREDLLEPVTITAFGTASSVVVGQTHVCISKTNGLVMCLGGNSKRQIDSNKGGLFRSAQYIRNSQALTFSVPSTASAGTAVTATLSSSSGLDPKLSVAGTGVCETSGNQIIFTGIGGCSITASQVGDDYFYQAATVLRYINVGAFAWSDPRANSVTTFRFRSSDGSPVTGLRVTWTTLGAEYPASGTALVTNANGTVSMTTISGPAVVRVVSVYSSDPSATMQKSTVNQFLRSFSTVADLSTAILDIDVGVRPSVVSKVVQVKLADGTPVPGAIVHLAVTSNIWTEPSRTFSGKYKAGFAIWNSSNQKDTVEPCFNDGNSFYDRSETNVYGITGSDGSITLRTYQSNGEQSLVTACYSDSDFTQKRTVAIASSGTTQISLGYLARVTVSVSTLDVSVGSQASVQATVVAADDTAVAGSGVQAMRYISDDRVVSADCAGAVAQTDARGIAQVNFCPTSSGYYYLRSNGAVPSQFIYIDYQVPGSSGGGSSDGGSSGGGSSGGVITLPPAPPMTIPAKSGSTENASKGSNTVNAPKLPLSAGSLIKISSPPPISVSQGVSVAVTSTKITVALKTPKVKLTAQKVSQYVVILKSANGSVVKRIVVTMNSVGQITMPVLTVPKSGEYSLQIVAKSKSGKTLGTWKSPKIIVGKRPNI